ncbi:MAG: oxidoreductase [Acidobacteria bacterium]|nr:oxidoreductase [Acidobacteriota bacterium]
MRALVAHSQTDVRLDDDASLAPEGEVVLDVAYSSLNYKDALAVTSRGRIVRRFPTILGIDIAGTVVSCTTEEFKEGDQVVGIAHGLGESDGGGYAEQQRVRAETLVPLADGLDLDLAMAVGTAGVTAMLCVMALERNGLTPDGREVAVTGAAGGVGSIAVMLLARAGYRVVASTGRPEQEPYLRSLGASAIIHRDELSKKGGPLQSERWAGAVDTVGGDTLVNLVAQTAYEGSVASCGMAGGADIQTAVWPFILRNVSILGVSTNKPSKESRIAAWARLAKDLDLDKLRELRRIEPLSKIRELSEEILAGQTRGRVVIDVKS